MKLNELTPNQLEQVLELECKNIIPILASVGIHLSKDDIAKDLESFINDEIVIIQKDKTVEGFFVYSLKEDYILIKTFNLNSFNNGQLLAKLLNGFASQASETSINLIKSHCHLTNKKSLNFHRKMGFKVAKQTEQHIEFEVSKIEILKTIKRRTRFIPKT